MKRAFRQWWRGSDGTAAIEFAIVGGLFFMIILGLIDLATNFYRLHYVSFIADQAIRKIYINPAISSADLQTWITGISDGRVTATLQASTRVTTMPEKDLVLTTPSQFVFLPVPVTLEITVSRTVPVVGPYF